ARIRKLVRQCSWAIRLFRQEILNYPRVPPPKQFVQIAKFLVKLVILRRADQNRFDQAQRSFTNRVTQRTNPCVRTDPFTVYDTGVQKFARDPPINVRARNDERAEKIPLSAFVYTKVRLEHFRRVHFFVTQLRFSENLRLQFKLHEFLHAFPLHQDLWPFLVDRNAQFVLLPEENRPFLRRELETELF